MRRVLLAAIVFSVIAAGCGDSDGDVPASPTATAATPGVQPTADATEAAASAALGDLSPLLLGQAVVPQGFRFRADRPATTRQVAIANVGIPELSIFIEGSTMEGAWTKFFTRDNPEAGLSSIVYRFSDAASATAFVQALGAIETADYPAATAVERVQSDPIEDASQMMRYRLQGSRTVEYTWAQGRLAGQIVLRYAGDTESPEDASLLVSLARQQAGLMSQYAQ